MSETIPSRDRLLGIPLGELGLFGSLLAAVAFAVFMFFATCFFAILALLIYNQSGHRPVDMADAYLYGAIPAGIAALGIGLIVMVGRWMRHKFSDHNVSGR